MDALPIEIRLVLTFAVGAVCGLLFKPTKLPAAFMVGALVGVATLNCATGAAYVPPEVRVGVQIVAGAFIGCSMERSDLARLKQVGGPVAVVLLACGVMVGTAGGFEPVTALMSTIPGGVGEIPLIAADMGADASVVAVLQLVRQTLGTSVMPTLMVAFDRAQAARGRHGVRRADAALNEEGRVRSRQRSATATVAVLAVAAVAGLIGKATGISGMTFAFSIAAALVMKLAFDFAYVPRWIKNVCRVVTGCYIGTFFSAEMIAGLGSLALPALVVAAFYGANCFVTGGILQRLFGCGRKESMLMASSAGASDMALVMDDLGVRNVDVAVVQAVRAIVVVAVFPQVINAVCFLLPLW
ncbi:MAG TPA: AbrB family transcriptional regulator [Candidatus Aveggerthella stercoripullorum]|uniref:AbrB family transcriptional regulator n=1 Tax=Candidatus Aveggerthella stercoripullorum TaxID=2840688 RepID=A0A9D1D406_9ACTN|nr:AbrB family transcriptional regulator [Candidatus Aveggerthella stercoripullorum]